MSNDEKINSKVDVSFGEVWKLKTDEKNYILMRKRGKGYGVEGYYNNLEQVFTTVFERTVRDGEAKTLNQMLTVVKKARSEMKKYAQELSAKWQD